MDWYRREKEEVETTNGVAKKSNMRIFQGTRNGLECQNIGKSGEVKQNGSGKCPLGLAVWGCC